MGTRHIPARSAPTTGTCVENAQRVPLASRPRGREENLGRAPCQWSTAGGSLDSQVTQPDFADPDRPGRTGLHRGHGLTRELRYHHTRLCRSYPHPRTRQIRRQLHSPPTGPMPRGRADRRAKAPRTTSYSGWHPVGGAPAIYRTVHGGPAKALVCPAALADYQFRTGRCNLDSRCCLHVCYRPFARDEHTFADLRTRRNHRVGAIQYRIRRRALAESSGAA